MRRLPGDLMQFRQFLLDGERSRLCGALSARKDTGGCSSYSNSWGNAARRDSRRKISDSALLARLKKLRGTERAVQRRNTLDLAEVERRRLYLPRGYGSLFEFCTEYLKYSRSSAARRIGAARCIARFPRMAALFRREECDLTVLSTISGVVTQENCAELAAWIKGRSLREIEAFAQRRQPERMLSDQVRQIYITRVTQERESSTDPARSLEGEPTVPCDDAKCKASFTFSPSAGTNRDRVFIRDGDRCTYVSKDGRRCEETQNLQIDHIIPYGKCGDHSPENLRLLCPAHNRLAAEKEYGREHVAKFYKRE